MGEPIVSTSANISGNEKPESSSVTIDQPILDGVDYVVTLRTEEIRTSPSTLVQIDVEEDGTCKTLRA